MESSPAFTFSELIRHDVEVAVQVDGEDAEGRVYRSAYGIVSRYDRPPAP